MRRLIWLPLAGALLIGGAAVAAAAPTALQDAAGTVLSVPGRAGDLLAEVLADLVSQGTITQAQSDAITDELDTRVEAKRAEMQAERQAMRAQLEQLRGFLEDDVITADEIASLPDGELKAALQSIAVDGQVTAEQLRGLRMLLGGPGGPGRGHPRGGPGFWGPPGDTDTNPETDQGS
ncbi:MAG TPA: hypothetical protein VH741_07885 [Candidatus Limnocylindrales bacterium]